MEAVAPDEKPRQPPANISAPPPPPQGRPLPPSDVSQGLPAGPPPPAVPPGPPAAGPPGQYEPTWSRPYPPYENANPEQRAHGPYSAPPRENPHAEMFQRHSISGPPRGPPESGYRPPVNGDGNPNPSLPGPPGDFRSRLPYGPGGGGPPPNAEPPPHGMPVMQADGMQTPLPHRDYPPQNQLSQPGAGYDPGGYFLNNSGGPFGQRQRRSTRAQQACDQCRARKAKCDEGRPSCSHCKESNIQCVYKDIPPHKHERATQLVLDKLQDIADRQEDLRNDIRQDIRQDIREDIQKEIAQKLDALLESREISARITKRRDPDTEAQGSTSSVKASPAAEPQPEKPSESALEPKSSQKQTAEDVKKEQVEEVADDEELSIPIEHTTAAHKLLRWPSIQKLLPKKIDHDYVMQLEERRGPIRPYGRGEGSEDQAVFGEMAASPMASASPQGEGEGYSALSPGVRFGTGFEFYRGQQQPQQQQQQQPLADAPSDSRSSPALLNLDPETIRAYHQSYVQNMHILHPFLSMASLDVMVANFIRNYCSPNRSFSSQLVQLKPGDGSATLPRAQKRKRSVDVSSSKFPGAFEPSASDRSPTTSNPPVIHRSMENAVVLLVLALGAICSWKADIPGPIQDPPPKSSLFAPLPGVSPVLPGSSFPSSSPFQSPSDSFGSHQSRRHFSSSQAGAGSDPTGDSTDPNRRNLDVVPGMAYYAIASDILGNLQGSTDLLHAQACLLAALYTGQLAHPFDSHGWISHAARACLVLVRPERFHRMPDGPMKELVSFVFWTCLQLESDILAELDLPASGISRLESRMNSPNGTTAHAVPNEIDSPEAMMMYYYMAQIVLRKTLNRVHTDLYKAERQNSTKRTTWSITVQEALSLNLENWRASLPGHMRWNDEDPPSNNINVARLRAKYYGARYIIYRPLLHHALHPMAPRQPQQTQVTAESPALSAVSSSQSHPSPAMPHNPHSEFMERGTSDFGGPPPHIYSSRDPQPSSLNDLDPKVLQACRTCIQAAINSTTAFDGIEGRPIVTNIFGTAHAQFGNMLVLSATYTSKLSSLVDGDELRQLLDRTISFLWQSRFISPTLRKDAEILCLIRSKLFDQQQAQSLPS